MLAIVEYDVKHPVGVLGQYRGQKPRAVSSGVQKRPAVAIADTFKIAVHCATRIVDVAAIAFAGSGSIDTGAVFRLVVVDNSVALVIPSFADQPAKYTTGFFRVSDA